MADEITAHVFTPSGADACEYCGYGASHVVHSAVRADEAVCGACGHAGELHNPKAFKGTCKGGTGCPCASPRESFECVEPQADAIPGKPRQITFEIGDDYAVVGTFDKPDTSLSLLVIDLGDSCVVKVERGDDSTLVMEGWGTQKLSTGSVSIEEIPFTAVRDAIDSQDKPLPRIERNPERATHEFSLICKDGYVDNLGSAAYASLTAINGGKPLPIWSGGTWELLTTETTFARLPLNVYRYTR